MTPQGNPAERAGRAAKTVRRRKRDRERVVGLAGAVLLAIPLLFAAVWTRTEVSSEPRRSDSLVAHYDSLHYELRTMTWKRSRLVEYATLEERLEATGLRTPRLSEVVWVDLNVREREGE